LGYLDLQIGANVKIPPVVFVTPKDNVEKLERARKKALSREEYQDVEFLTQFYILEEGTETSFFLNDSATEYEVVREETKETEQQSISISVPDNDPEEIARLKRLVSELEEKLKDMDYWVEKATTLQRLVKEQQEWIEALTDRLRGQWLTRRVLEDFTKTNLIPQTKYDFDKEA
jgi:predicted RNase H-like nuclease (RuvC/YqgF family)